MKEFHVPAYDETTGQGLLRHVLIRRAVYTKQIMVCMIVNAERLPKEEILVQRLQAIPEMTGITLNTNTGKEAPGSLGKRDDPGCFACI